MARFFRGFGMKLIRLRISNFQSFAEEPTTITFEPTTFLVGPNGAGKTAVMQALARMFAVNLNLRRVQRSDFHVPQSKLQAENEEGVPLWIEAEFVFPELRVRDPRGKYATIPTNFAHMRLETGDGVPLVRFRLEAQLDQDGEIEEALYYVLQADENGVPLKKTLVPKHDRQTIHVHYLPARRDPAEQISYATHSLLGRALRAANWQAEREQVVEHTTGISAALATNDAVKTIGEHLSTQWSGLHKGDYYARPRVSFDRKDIDILLRYITVDFAPGHDSDAVDFSRLSDGHKSLLYLSLVLAMQGLSRAVLSGEISIFDREKLRPAVFTLIAMEEPENSLSPHHLGRVIKSLSKFASHHDAQAVLATHAPSLLKRVAPESIRYLRLDESRRTSVKTIIMPPSQDEAYKFVREAVQAFPEVYFSRLVILGEGDSEEIVLPRLLHARGMAEDDSSIAVVPLGGRHVNHFWRLLHGLGIPYFTLLDLDLGRFGGGWGRIKYAAQQLATFPPAGVTISVSDLSGIPKWNSNNDNVCSSKFGQDWLRWLESLGVFFSAPLDLDFAMLQSFPDEFGVDKDELEDPDADTISDVLGTNHQNIDQYEDEEKDYFGAYRTRFKVGSKPVAHLQALAELDNVTLKGGMPAEIGRLLDAVKKRLAELPE